MQKRSIDLEIKVGLFVSIGVGLIMLALITLGGTKSLFTKQSIYYVECKKVSGLISGAKVVLNGIRIGIVDKIAFNREKRNIKITLSIPTNFEEWLREDSKAEIATQGVLGDKYVSLSAGTLESRQLKPGATIPMTPGKDLDHFLSSGDQLMSSLNSIGANADLFFQSITKNNRNEELMAGLAQTAKHLGEVSKKLDDQLTGLKLKEAIDHLNGIMKKIDNGKGTLGALINDPSLYDDAKLLLGGANRNRVMRNLIRQTIQDGAPSKASTPKNRKPSSKTE